MSDQDKPEINKFGLTIPSKGSAVKTFAAEASKMLGAAVLFIVLVVVLFMVTVNSLAGLVGFVFLFFGFIAFLLILLLVLIAKREVKTYQNGGVPPAPSPEQSEGMSLGVQIALGVICVLLFAVIFNAVASS